MNYGAIKNFDVANGPGVRVSLFVSGCTHHCRGCFNPETWNFSYGQPFTEETQDHLMEMLSSDVIQGLTLLGWEPMEPQNQEVLLPFLQRVRKELPKKDIWCFTGYQFDDDIMGRMADQYPFTLPFLKCIDILVDGTFQEERKNMMLLFKGSENQRIIQVQDSLRQGKVVRWPADLQREKELGIKA